jgi:hypothetical protein
MGVQQHHVKDLLTINVCVCVCVCECVCVCVCAIICQHTISKNADRHTYAHVVMYYCLYDMHVSQVHTVKCEAEIKGVSSPGSSSMPLIKINQNQAPHPAHQRHNGGGEERRKLGQLLWEREDIRHRTACKPIRPESIGRTRQCCQEQSTSGGGKP